MRSGKRRVRARLRAGFSRTKTHRPRVIVPPSAPQPAIQPLQRLARVSASTARRIHISVRCGGRTLSTVTGEFWSQKRFSSRPMHTSRQPSTKNSTDKHYRASRHAFPSRSSVHIICLCTPTVCSGEGKAAGRRNIVYFRVIRCQGGVLGRPPVVLCVRNTKHPRNHHS